jgi:Arc/MetJ family transcription regulator
MSRLTVDLDDAALALAQRRLGTRTKREIINQALMIAASTRCRRKGPRLGVAPGQRRHRP